MLCYVRQILFAYEAQTALEAWSDFILFANMKTYTKITDAGAKVSTTEKGGKVIDAVKEFEKDASKLSHSNRIHGQYIKKM